MSPQAGATCWRAAGWPDTCSPRAADFTRLTRAQRYLARFPQLRSGSPTICSRIHAEPHVLYESAEHACPVLDGTESAGKELRDSAFRSRSATIAGHGGRAHRAVRSGQGCLGGHQLRAAQMHAVLYAYSLAGRPHASTADRPRSRSAAAVSSHRQRQTAAEDPFRLALRKNPKASVWVPYWHPCGIFTGRPYGTASRGGRPLRPEVFPDEASDTARSRHGSARVDFSTLAYNSTEALPEVVAANLGIVRLAGRDRSAAFHVHRTR
jgi:hypothetical protein